jgi:hypothetical protein
MQHRMVVSFLPPSSCSINPVGWHHILSEPFTTHIIPYGKVIPAFFLDCLTFGNGTDKLSRKFGR